MQDRDHLLSRGPSLAEAGERLSEKYVAGRRAIARRAADVRPISNRSISNKIHQQLEVTMTDRDTPPDGGNAGKPMRAAISAALRREAEGDDGETAPTLALIVNKLISRALGGDMSAIKEILDRMDGKTTAGAIEDEGPRRVIVRWKD
jgi:hypothetical protein